MRCFLLIMLCVSSFCVHGQDERFYRDIFSGGLYKPPQDFEFKILVESPKYVLDLNSDGVEDSFQTVKKDGVDFIKINDPFGKVKFEKALDAKGVDSKIFRINLKAVKPRVNVLILHYYEGKTQAAVFEASARLYFVTIHDNDLNQITMTKGPYFWSEREGVAGKYWRKRYSVNLVDYNKDGTMEISVSYNKSQKIYFYSNDRTWKLL